MRTSSQILTELRQGKGLTGGGPPSWHSFQSVLKQKDTLILEEVHNKYVIVSKEAVE
jgi:hypothetical protein